MIARRASDRNDGVCSPLCDVLVVGERRLKEKAFVQLYGTGIKRSVPRSARVRARRACLGFLTSALLYTPVGAPSLGVVSMLLPSISIRTFDSSSRGVIRDDGHMGDGASQAHLPRASLSIPSRYRRDPTRVSSCVAPVASSRIDARLAARGRTFESLRTTELSKNKESH